MTVRTRSSILGVAIVAVAALAACSDDNNGIAPIPPGAAEITLDIETSRTLYAETTYTLKGFIHVKSGATLTVMPGTTIQGALSPAGSSLFILPGGKIQAVGTATKPIVFTSSNPAGSRQPGDWGGLIIVGKAIDNRSAGSPSGVEVEGTNTCGAGCTTSGQNYQVIYSGGSDNADDSGELRYVRVEFAGFAPSNGNELNSFTFAARRIKPGSRLRVVVGALNSIFYQRNFNGGGVVSYESQSDSRAVTVKVFHDRLRPSAVFVPLGRNE